MQQQATTVSYCGHTNSNEPLRSIFLDFIHRPYVFLQSQRFEGWFFPRHQVNLLCWVRSVELASVGVIAKNIRTMDVVQKIDRSNTAPS
jgi:hypothetical protein